MAYNKILREPFSQTKDYATALNEVMQFFHENDILSENVEINPKDGEQLIKDIEKLDKKKDYQPFISLGICFYLLNLSFFYSTWLFLPLIIITIIFFIILQKRKGSWIGYLQNGMISIGGFYLLYYLFY